jgi:hypothetical protein
MDRRKSSRSQHRRQARAHLLISTCLPSEKRLRIGMTYGSAKDLPPRSTGPRATADAIHFATSQAGYDAMQGGDAQLCRAHGLQLLGSGVVPAVADAEAFVAHWKQQGAVSATCIAGYGFESDAEMDALAWEIIELSNNYQLPIYIETHRASITQDAWRTVQLAHRVPQVRFTGDFSHWFTGQEMLYGDFTARLNRLTSVFERVRFLHGRIGSRCCMQVNIGENLQHESVQYFRNFWILAMRGFLNADDSGRDLWFCPELLGPEYQYAHVYPSAHGQPEEDGDRWLQAKLLVRLAKECFEEAARIAPPNATGEGAS